MSGRFPPRIFRRVPFEAELRLRFDGGEEVTARSANVSLGGMYVVTAEPRQVGSTFELSFKLPEQPAPVRGRGRVAWVRPEGEGAGQPAGMGVRFLELTPGSRELIFEVVERRARDGGSPYDDGEDTGTIADRRGAGGVGAGIGATAAAAPSSPSAPSREAFSPDLRDTPDPLPWPPAGEPAPVRPSARPPAGADRESSGLRPSAPAPPVTAAESPGDASFAEPVADRAAVGPWDRGPAASFEEEPEPPAPPARPSLPPVEMPEPPRTRWEDAARGGASGGYARARRRGGLGWRLAAGVAIALMAGGAWWLLRGGEVSIAAGDRPPAAARPSADRPAGGGEGPDGLTRSGGASADPDAGGGAAGAGAVAAAGATGGDLPPESAGGPGTAADPSAPSAPPQPVAGAAAGSAGVVPEERPGGDRPPGAAARGGAAAAPSLSGTSPAPSVAGAPAPPAAAPPVVTPAPASAGPARRVTHITWRQEDGVTELVIWGDGRFDPGAVRLSTLGGERPRALVRLIGIGSPFDGGSVEVGTPQVQRVRTGLHLETAPVELHVVVDLANGRVTTSEVQEDGERLRLRLEER